MDAMVIGAGGFVGGYLLRQLMTEGKMPGATKLPRERVNIGGCEVFDLDLGNENAVRRLLSEHRPAQIYHLAAQSSVAVSWKEPELTAQVNVIGTLHLLEAIRSIPDYYPRVLLVGSGIRRPPWSDCPLDGGHSTATG
ncbi:MAG: GDP-mannose 4,6-dehydratase [Oscillospiraceae bacterium]|nr:GDP-mannose 4,6-dehydratase [Oscillospiraceae bacterium]